MTYQRKFKKLRVARTGRRCYCVVCKHRLLVGQVKYCSNQCKKLVERIESKIDYQLNKKNYARKSRIRNQKRQSEWNKLSDDEKYATIMAFNREYLKMLSDQDGQGGIE